MLCPVRSSKLCPLFSTGEKFSLRCLVFIRVYVDLLPQFVTVVAIGAPATVTVTFVKQVLDRTSVARGAMGP